MAAPVCRRYFGWFLRSSIGNSVRGWPRYRLRQMTTGYIKNGRNSKFSRILFPAAPLLSLSFWGSAPPEPEAAKTPEPEPDPELLLIHTADVLYDANNTKELYDLLIQHKDSKNDELLWRLARAARDLAQLSTTETNVKKTLTYEALAHAKKALDANDGNFACHKWYAICISDVGDYEGTKQKIANAFVIRDHFLKAIELNPSDATSIHLMGLWCFTFAEMPWYQQKIATVIFAKPPESTYNEALTYFMRAENVDPNFYSMNLLMLAKTYIKLNDNKMALLYLTKTLDYAEKTEEDQKAHKEAEELMKKVK
ncbi:regulator of microtubule dynamics protein 1-like [Saccoglossus kowalevskii]|uniref:Regulator of microtubule dynamics protein 1 n=1 Tax=Saccoglossus kowalevskii TaxID=10224 RepID=A0ABM0GQT3_SACKO|nr:PREDICTED: regulator of microtubule dynamics protein 1-like [Saccoglossus kowalevskii]